MRRIFIGFLVLAALGSVVTPALATPPSEAELAQLLAGFEQTPDAAAFREWGPETLSILVALYDEPGTEPLVRMRAVAAAAHYPSPEARAFLLRVAHVRGQSDLVIREAVRG